jgi:hypothetical protein
VNGGRRGRRRARLANPSKRSAPAGRHEVDAALQPWSVAEADYPAAGAAKEKLRFLVRFAILAPSGHNTQPWLFRLGDQAIELYADRARALPVVDPHDRALTISCGAALATLRIAAGHFGQRAIVDAMPHPGHAELLARISIEPGQRASEDDEQLFRAIPKRHSSRQAFEDRELPAELTERLLADVQQEGVWLHLAADDDRLAIAGLVAEGERAQWADKRFRHELASWMRPNRSRSRDGMRGYGFGFGELMSRAAPLLIRSIDPGEARAAKDRELVKGSGLIGIFGTDADDPAAWLATGKALQRVLLRARAAGVWSSFLNPPIEVPWLRPRLASAVGHRRGYPQLVARFGYGPAIEPEPRRAAEDVLVEEVG